MFITYLLTILLISFYNVDGSVIKKRVDTSGYSDTDLCDSPIYCHGELLETIQLAQIFNDSKSFVDLYQKHDPSVTLENFEKLMTETKREPSRNQLKQFINDYFERSEEIMPWTPPDMYQYPPILKKIVDSNFREWIMDLNHIWKTLARKMSPKVLENPSRHSFIPVEHGFIVPGGRFEESYYWDSYWTIEGLLLSGMHETAKGILLNFFSMIQRYGFIPNGGRVYYLMRSQPPLLISMVEKYIEATNDKEFLVDNLHLLEKEFAFFQREKTIDVYKNGKTYKMARYFVKSLGPRPESYREDYINAQYFKTDEEKQTFYDDMKAGAESGWDYSSRWFINNHDDAAGNLTDISTRNIIPVDLNSFLQRNARKLSKYNEYIGNTFKAKQYKEIAISYQEAINDVLWNEEAGIWFDYDLKNGKPRKDFFPTNLTPLYTNSFDKSKSSIYATKAVDYLKSQSIAGFLGGVPTSLNPSGQQWDAPNAWPPLQSIIVQGLYNTQSEPALGTAKVLATRWIRSNYIGFKHYHQMFEKYDASIPGEFGGGGEYPVQEGFGWTNGVVFEFLDMYPNMTVSD